MRSLLVVALAGSSVIAAPAASGEPLILHIRSNAAAPASLGAAGSHADDEAAARARALREAVWARSDRRARIAIASVCTGCLRPPPPAAGLDRRPAKDDGAATGSIADPPAVPPRSAALLADSR